MSGKLWLSMVLVGLMGTTFVACGGDEKAEKDSSTEDDDDGKKKKKKKKKKKSDDDDEDTKEAKDDDEAPKGDVGLKAKDNDKEVVDLAKKIVDGCELKKWGYDRKKCSDYETWSKGEMFKGGAKDKTLVNLLEDPKMPVRRLAADALRSRGEKYEEDEAMAKRVVAALEREKDEKTADSLASVVADIRLEKTDLVDEVIDIAKTHSVKEVGQGIVNEVLFRNRENEKIYEFVKNTAETHSDDEMRYAALRGFWTGTPKGKNDEVCALWRKLAITDDDTKVAAKALELAFQNPSARCKGEYEDLLKHAEKKAKEGTVKETSIAFGLKYLFRQKDAPDALKKRALAAAKTLLANEKNSGQARGWALRFIGEADPGAKALAAKYKDDEDFSLKHAAKAINEGKIKLKK